MPCIPEAVRTTIRNALLQYGGDDGQRALRWLEKPPLDDLTEREIEIIQCVAKGISNREIGAELFISERTVRTHITSILSKLGLPNRTRLALWAYQSEVASIEDLAALNLGPTEEQGT